ncbi:MAG: SDR family NAD(P)-dependent oxidoreductase [Alphaproteobacteria bacterium]|nr:SDR family NAD(P)-dependent oxidoreductase [Alphaproteobacteria bacterium]
MATVVVTGANRGIGLAFARALAARGDTVIGTAREASRAPELAEVARVASLDVRDDASVAAFAASLEGQAVDLLINNAGILLPDDLASVTADTVLAQLDTNAVGPLRVTQALRANLAAAPAAKVANITSRMGSIADNGSGRFYGYRSSKAALNAITVSLARDLAPIPVVALHPGMVATDMVGGHGDVTPDEAAAKLLGLIDALDAEGSGGFLHRDGYALPW